MFPHCFESREGRQNPSFVPAGDSMLFMTNPALKRWAIITGFLVHFHPQNPQSYRRNSSRFAKIFEAAILVKNHVRTAGYP